MTYTLLANMTVSDGVSQSSKRSVGEAGSAPV